MQLLVSFQWLIERNMILFASLLEWLKYVLFQDSRKALEYFFEVSAYSHDTSPKWRINSGDFNAHWLPSYFLNQL